MRRRTLLLPYDGTAWADDLLRLACQLALGSEKHMAVLVLSVTRIPPSLPLAPLPASVDCRGHAMLDHAEEVANSQGYAVETCLARAYHVADAIVAAAADLQADAILLALSPGRWPWTRWAYARTVRAVRHHAPCPMLTGSPAATDDLDALAAIAAAQRLVSRPTMPRWRGRPSTGGHRRGPTPSVAATAGHRGGAASGLSPGGPGRPVGRAGEVTSMVREPGRPDPDELLARIKAAEKPTRGRLRLYLGAAAGVGKTFTMLEEAHRRKERGTDVVIGWVETHGRAHTAELIGDLESVPPREIEYRGTLLKEMDVDAVLRRHPQVALVDELAHTNVPGSKHEKRYEDVRELLDAGIDVISTLNIQHVESLNDTVQQLTGVAVRETIPDWVVDQADEVELIDISPRALIQRMKHGNIYPPEQAQRALDNFFTPANLTALRDLALRATAREVENDLSRYMQAGGETGAPVGVGERIMVAVDHRPMGKTLIRRGWRMAAAFKGELVVVHVEPDQGMRQAQSVEDERRLRAALQLADELGAEVVRLRGKVADELIAYANTHKVTHIVIGHPTHSRWEEFLHGSVTNDLLRKLRGVDVHVIADPDQAGAHHKAHRT